MTCFTAGALRSRWTELLLYNLQRSKAHTRLNKRFSRLAAFPTSSEPACQWRRFENSWFKRG